jgi:hypothetical protein
MSNKKKKKFSPFKPIRSSSLEEGILVKQIVSNTGIGENYYLYVLGENGSFYLCQHNQKTDEITWTKVQTPSANS